MIPDDDARSAIARAVADLEALAPRGRVPALDAMVRALRAFADSLGRPDVDGITLLHMLRAAALIDELAEGDDAPAWCDRSREIVDRLAGELDLFGEISEG